jgi:hypothetical protein
MTHAVQISDDNIHFVGIGSLRVIIQPDGDGWYAQGIEIDYGATGRSVDEVKRNFEIGLARTIDLHLERWGTIERILKFAPASEWEDLRGAEPYKFSITLVHSVPTVSEKTPFPSIAYLQAA